MNSKHNHIDCGTIIVGRQISWMNTWFKISTIFNYAAIIKIKVTKTQDRNDKNNNILDIL